MEFGAQAANLSSTLRHRAVVPSVVSRTGILTTSFKLTTPEPFANKVKSSFVPLVISVAAPVKVRVPAIF